MSEEHSVRLFLREFLFWMECDLHQNGPGPSGGFTGRVEKARRACEEFDRLHPDLFRRVGEQGKSVNAGATPPAEGVTESAQKSSSSPSAGVVGEP